MGMLTKSSLVGLFVHQNNAREYLGQYLNEHLSYPRGGGLGIQLESRNEALDAIKKAHNDVIALALWLDRIRLPCNAIGSNSRPWRHQEYVGEVKGNTHAKENSVRNGDYVCNGDPIK
jgi:hypothetical protein